MVGDVEGCDSPAVPGGGVRVPGEEEVDHVYLEQYSTVQYSAVQYHVYLEQWHNIYPETADNENIIGKSLTFIWSPDNFNILNMV